MKSHKIVPVLAGTAVLLAGCSGAPTGEDPAAPEKQADSISIVLAQYSTNTQGHWEKIIEDFTKDHPDVKVDLQVLDWGALTPTVNTLIQTQQYPDILNFGNWASYAAEDLLYPASDVLSSTVMDDFLPAFAENSQLKGTQFAMPMVASVNVLYYNEDILGEAGIAAPPKTFDELLSQCEKIKALPGDIATYGLALGAVGGTAEATLWTYSGGGAYFDDGEWVINSDTNVDTFDYLKKLTEQGCTQPNPGQTNTGDGTFPLFQHGKAAMVYATLGNSPAFMGPITEAGLKVGTTTHPTANGAEPLTLGIQDNLLAFKKPGNKELVADLLARYYEPERYAELAKLEGLFPTTHSALDITLKDPESGLTPADLELMEKSRFYPTSQPAWTAVNARIKSDIGLTVTDGSDVRATLNALQDVAAAG
ncbi:MAG: extracellular solute-binding protein [Microbacterium sp.]